MTRIAPIFLFLVTGCSQPTGYDEVQELFTTRCIQCHSGESAPAGMELDDAYDNIVDVPSTEVPELDRIEPGDPDLSYLWLKVEGRAAEVDGVDTQMPLDGTGPLSGDELDLLETWILDGASRE